SSKPIDRSWDNATGQPSLAWPVLVTLSEPRAAQSGQWRGAEETRRFIMVVPKPSLIVALPVTARLFLATLASAAAFACLFPSVEAQALQAQSAPFVGIVVVGEGRVTVAPDYAQITSGVTTRGKTVQEASDANSKTMAAVIKALVDSGIAQNDVQTSRFSVQRVYLPPGPGIDPKLAAASDCRPL